MEWAAYTSGAGKHQLAWTLSCAGLEEQGEHPEGCFADVEHARVILPDLTASGGDRTCIMDPTAVLEYIGDLIVDWGGLEPLERLRFMGVCVPGLLASDDTPYVAAAWNLLGIEGVCESFSQLPYPGGVMVQPMPLTEALSIIRSQRNQIQERRIAMASRANSQSARPQARLQ